MAMSESPEILESTKMVINTSQSDSDLNLFSLRHRTTTTAFAVTRAPDPDDSGNGSTVDDRDRVESSNLMSNAGENANEIPSGSDIRFTYRPCVSAHRKIKESPLSSDAIFKQHTSVSPDRKLITVVGDHLDGLFVDSQNGKEKVQEKVGLGSTAESGKGKSKMSKNITHGYHLVKGKAHHSMEDYVFAEFKQVGDSELGLFAIFDGHLSHVIPDYLKSHLFDNILNEPDFWTEPENAIRKAYCITDTNILEKAVDLGQGGSIAVTAILINCHKLVIANVGDSQAVICRNGEAKQLSIDHEPVTEKESIENRGGFVSNFPGDVARVDGQLAVARAVGSGKSLKEHLSSEPDVTLEMIDDDTELIILASDGLWKVMTNQEAVDAIRNIKDARSAAKHLTEEAVKRNSSDDISCIVVRF